MNKVSMHTLLFTSTELSERLLATRWFLFMFGRSTCHAAAARPKGRIHGFISSWTRSVPGLFARLLFSQLLFFSPFSKNRPLSSQLSSAQLLCSHSYRVTNAAATTQHRLTNMERLCFHLWQRVYLWDLQ